jgi:hypothetical protein
LIIVIIRRVEILLLLAVRQKDLDTSMGNNKESCDEIILGIREKITRFVLSKVDQELNKLQELSVNCQQQQNFNSPNDNNNQL